MNGTQCHSIFTKNTLISHPETGLFADYVGLYTPSDTVIHNTAIFSMTTSTCHLIPLSAAEKIPSCNITSEITSTRSKRAFPALIALGAGMFSFGLSTPNMFLTMNLHNEIALVANLLKQVSERIETHGAYLLTLESNQIRLGAQLQTTQKLLDNTLSILDVHNNEFIRLADAIEHLKHQFHQSFLYTAMTRIFRHELTLEFLASNDLPKVIYDIINRGNLKFNTQYGSLPLAQIITKLLIRQQFDFIPDPQYTKNDPATTTTTTEIGRLVITSFFAVPKYTPIPFQVYKLLAVPFFRQNETVQLAGIPKYWAINPATNSTMEWYEQTEFGCDLQLMTTCRDTPPIRKLSNHTCFEQIMGNHLPSKCYTTFASTYPYFVQQLRDNLWITSSSTSLHCLRMSKVDYRNSVQRTWNFNEHIILPSIALVNITPGYNIACPGFTIMGPMKEESTALSLKIIYNNSLLTNNNLSIINIHEYLNNRTTTWFNNNNMNHYFMKQPSVTSPHRRTFRNIDFWIFGTLIISWIFFGITITYLHVTYRRPSSCLQHDDPSPKSFCQ